MLRTRLIRIGTGVGLALGSIALTGPLGISTTPAGALGPEGCTASGANGFIAVGTFTGTATPSTSASTSTACPADSTQPGVTISQPGGWVGGDAASWSVTVDIAHASALDSAGMPCGWTAWDSPAGTETASGSGPTAGTGGVGCIEAGGTILAASAG